ncbi:FAD:protein FMN transferase [Nitratireductor indicus]|uniref:FAD:protein FMN transferase n=1 Tax=Nitratireductor indicus TaxID=721133 RepID=UPI0028751959|nr:FAD:protein FMN transferase [Nitratireductor indicus]MDS1136644.1 FAD:protein FMN transferase [Nitratireductor indicus]
MSAFQIRPSRRTLLGMIGSLLAAPAIARSQTRAVEVMEGRAFATGWRLTLPAGGRGEVLRAPIEALLAEVDRQMSPWRADSVVSRFNAAGAGEYAVPAETAAVTAAALRIARDSGGRFDPTVGPLVGRWGFGPIEGDGVPDWHGLAAGETDIGKSRPGLTLDLCGIAKGRALDGMAEIVRGAGHDDFLIDLGGELAAGGRHPSGRDWQVAVEDPRGDGLEPAGMLRLGGMAVATSGGRAQSYSLNGRSYSHIIDPATGEPVAGALASVSVIGQAAMWADGWATALAAAGPVEGLPLARRAGISALFLIREDAGLRHEATGTFDRHLI